MSNIGSFARIDGEYRATEPCAPPEMSSAARSFLGVQNYPRLELMLRHIEQGVSREQEALLAFGLPADLPATTNSRSTVANPVVLPSDMTATLRRVREARAS